jgi:hypothetical protein
VPHQLFQRCSGPAIHVEPFDCNARYKRSVGVPGLDILDVNIPKVVVIAASVAMDLEIDHVADWQDFKSGRIVNSVSHAISVLGGIPKAALRASKLYPKLWPTADRARGAYGRHLGKNWVDCMEKRKLKPEDGGNSQPRC